MRPPRGRLGPLVAAALLMVTACGGDAKRGGTGGPGVEELACVPDPVAVAAERDCFADDQCPCGAHCELGRCVASCGQGLAACAASEACDRFGRCRPADDTSLAGPPAVVASGELVLDTPTLYAGSPSSPAELHFRAQDHDLGPVRVTATAPYQVRCGGVGAFGDECFFDDVAVGTQATVEVQLPDGSPVTDPGSVMLYSGGGVSSSSVQPPSADGAATPQLPVTGQYEGTLQLIGEALTDAAAPTLTTVRGMTVPVRVAVYPGTPLVVELVDPLQVLGPAGRLVAPLDAPAGGALPELALPPWSMHADTLAPTAAVAVVAEPSVVGVAYEPLSQSLSFQLTLAARGVTEGGTVPVLRYSAVLQRVADLSAAATVPALTTAAALPAASATVETPWETATLDALPGWTAGTRTTTEFQALLAASGDVQGTPSCTAASCPRSLDVCARDARDAVVPTALWTTSFGESWPLTDFNAGATPVDVTVASAGRPLVGVLLRPVLDRVSAVTITSVTAPITDGIPCAVQFAPNASNRCIAAGSVSYGFIDRCAEIAAQYGCEPQDDGATGVAFSVTGSVTQVDLSGTVCTDAVGTAGEDGVTVDGTVTRTCRYSGAAPCGELLECYGGSSPASLATSAVDRATSPRARGGDLDCVVPAAGATRSLATPADQAADGAIAAGTLASQCFADVARLREALPALGTSTGGEALDQLFAASPCLDAPRHLVALGFATEHDRARALGQGSRVDLRNSRFAHRLVQQWLDVHALIASESNQRLAVPDAALTGLSSMPLLAPPKDMLNRSLDGWALVLHPRFATALAALPDAALLAPDYRSPLLGTTPADGGHRQPIGLPVAMLDTLRVQLSLTRSLLEDAARRNDGTVLESAGRMFRTAALVEPLATTLAGRAQAAATSAQPLLWADAWERSARAYASARSQALAAASALARGENPLGISDADLPLYFFGGATDPAARFSAVSDYLLGTGVSTTAWAPAMVNAASAAAADMRTAYVTQANRQYQEALATADQTRRLDDIRASAGGTIANLCGLPEGLPAASVLEGWETAAGRPFRAGDCFRRGELSNCQATAGAPMTLADVKYHLCVARVENAFTANVVSFPDGNLTALVQDGALGVPASLSVSAIQPITQAVAACTQVSCSPTAPAGAVCVGCGTLTATATADALASAVGVDRVPSVFASAAAGACGAAFPSARRSLTEFLPRVSRDPHQAAACLSGSLGELAMTVQAAATDVKIANADFDSLTDAYRIAMQSCLIQQAGDASVTAATTSFNETMSKLERQKTSADNAAAVAGAVKDCAATAAGAELSPVAIGATAVACGAAFAEAGATIASNEFQLKMDDAERSHDLTIQAMQANTAFQVCSNDATMQLVAARAATLRISRALQDVAAAQLDLNEGIREAQAAWDEGVAALEDARGRTFRPPAIDGWVDANVLAYQRSMRLARRMTYLAVRAVEYEYQASLAARADVLLADTPEQLQQVIDGLRATAGTRRINGNAPSALKTVVSLRQHVLQLGDASQVAASEQRMSDVQRFRTRLARRYAVVDAQGVFGGVRIPFSLAPLGSGKPGNAMGIPIFSSADCAERVWSVNASIVGGAGLYRGDATTFTRVTLEKSNTFFSHWCGTPPVDGPPFQSASVRPSRNLFRDPAFGVGSIGSTPLGGNLGVSNADDAWSQARIQAYFNVPRATFEADSYANGETAELAGRGLYGQYELVIPPEVISVRQTDGSYTNGLDLDQVDDILLRLDYVSVAN